MEKTPRKKKKNYVLGDYMEEYFFRFVVKKNPQMFTVNNCLMCSNEKRGYFFRKYYGFETIFFFPNPKLYPKFIRKNYKPPESHLNHNIY